MVFRQDHRIKRIGRMNLAFNSFHLDPVNPPNPVILSKNPIDSTSDG
jgi:hypothetical protein